MIKSFKNKYLGDLLRLGRSKGLPSELTKRLRVRLEAIDSAESLEDIRLPGYDLHELKGDREGFILLKFRAIGESRLGSMMEKLMK